MLGIPNTFCNKALYQVNNVPDIKGKFLDFIFGDNYSDISISKCLSHVLNVDILYHEPIDIYILTSGIKC